MKERFQRFPEEFRHELIKFYKKAKQKKPIVPKRKSMRTKHKTGLLVTESESKVSIFFSLANTENDSFFEKVDLFLAQICFTLSSLSYNTINNSISFMTFIYSTIAKRWLSEINYK